MIVFDLACKYEHHFEGWFRDAEEYQLQLETGLLTCPVCGDENIIRIPSASHINLGTPQKKLTELATIQQDAQQLAARIKKFVSEHFEDVGDDFAREAKKIHYGEAENRNIHGTASLEEVQELNEEGIETIALPLSIPDKDKLN